MQNTLLFRIKRWTAYHAYGALSSCFYSNRHGYQRWIRKRRWRQSMEIMKAREPELYALARSMVGSLKFDANAPHPRYSDMLFLFEETMRRRPLNILECGAGASSLAFAYALKKIEQQTGVRGRLVSLDESEEYLNRLVSPAFPEELRSYVEFRPTPITYYQYHNTLSGCDQAGICYRDLPPGQFDLIYVDGPEVRRNAYEDLTPLSKGGSVPAGLTAKPFDSDCINYLMRSDTPVCIMIDQRIDTRWKLKQLLRKPVSAPYHFAAQKTVITARPEQAKHLERQPIPITEETS